MNIAKIVCGKDGTFSESGAYKLILDNGKIIGEHGCSNRSFANHDLTEWRLKELEENNIDVVISNGEVVWSRTGDNSETMKEFYMANSRYEAIHCYR